MRPFRPASTMMAAGKAAYSLTLPVASY